MAKKSKAAAGKTPFHTVVEKFSAAPLPTRKFPDYFVAQPNPQKPFDFTVGLNRAAVDFQGVESRASLPTRWRTTLRSVATFKCSRGRPAQGVPAQDSHRRRVAIHGFDCRT